LDIYAYAILPNAYHFLFKNTEEWLRLSQFVRRLQISYAMYYKKKYRDLPKTFSVFPQRFMTEYIWNQENYDKIAQRIHLAPMYQNLVKQISDWPYTSAHQVADTGYRSQWETHIKILWAMPHDLKTRISSRRREDFLNF
jgi:REP element-mobilizing transposase RayT